MIIPFPVLFWAWKGVCELVLENWHDLGACGGSGYFSRLLSSLKVGDLMSPKALPLGFFCHIRFKKFFFFFVRATGSILFHFDRMTLRRELPVLLRRDLRARTWQRKENVFKYIHCGFSLFSGCPDCLFDSTVGHVGEKGVCVTTTFRRLLFIIVAFK